MGVSWQLRMLMARYEDLVRPFVAVRPVMHACREIGLQCGSDSAATPFSNLQVCVWRETSDCPDRPLLLRPPRSPVRLPGKALVRPTPPGAKPHCVSQATLLPAHEGSMMRRRHLVLPGSTADSSWPSRRARPLQCGEPSHSDRAGTAFALTLWRCGPAGRCTAFRDGIAGTWTRRRCRSRTACCAVRPRR